MSDTTITGLPQTNAINGTAVLPTDYSGTTYKVTANTLGAWITTNATTVSATGNVAGANAIFTGTATTGVYALDVGASAAFLSNTVGSFTANVNNYTQLTLQNLSTGADATADFILTADNGNDTVNYSDFGIINSGYDNATPTNSLGNIVFAADTYLYAQGNTGNASQSGGNLAIGTTVSGKNVKIFAGGITNSSIIANIGNTGVAVTGTVSATGNISTAGAFVGNGAALTNVTVSVAGNVIGTQSNVTLTAGSYNWTFDNTGNTAFANGTVSVTTLTASGNITGGNIRTGGLISATGNVTGGNVLTSGVISSTGNITGGNISATNHTGTTVSVTGNITAANFFGNGNTLSNVATRFESAWTVPVGNSTQSFTVAASETYYLWVDCNIPNGILAWNAIATVTNTNVPVVGAQYAWVYNGGGSPIDFTSIPNQFVGTSNTIVRSSVAPSATTNRFDFGLNNTSGGNVTVRYGWIVIS